MKPYTTLHTLCASLIALLCALFAPPLRAQAQEAYVHQSTDKATLTFFYDKQRSSRDGTTWSINDQKEVDGTMVPAWVGTEDAPDGDIIKAVFDASFKDFRPTTTANWLQFLLALETVEGLENLNTSQVTNMSRMFHDNIALKAIDLSHFQTENVTNMSRMFYRCLELKKLNISNFNTKSVTDMSEMFAACSSLKSLDIKHFNTEKVEEMGALFSECNALTSLDLSNFNTEKVKSMEGMFYKCQALTSLDLSNFNTENVKEIDGMFQDCTMLEWVDLTNFQMRAASTTHYMFSGCVNLTTIFCDHSWGCLGDEAFNNCPKLKGAVAYDATKTDPTMANPTTGYFTIKLQAYAHQSEDKKTLTFFYDKLRATRKGHTWGINDQKKVDDTMVPAWTGAPDGDIKKAVFDPSFKDFRPTTTASWLQSLLALETVEGLENLNTSQVTNMSRMFHDNIALKAIDLSHFQTENVTNMSRMFDRCLGLKELDLSNFNTEKVTDMSGMFAVCESLKKINISNFNTKNVTDMSRMFYDCRSLKKINISNFNTENVEEMNALFSECIALTSLDLSNFNTEKVKRMGGMFYKCRSLTSLNLSNFNTENVKEMDGMFENCTMLEWVDLTNVQMGAASTASYMFADCVNLTTIFCNHSWSSKFDEELFNNCPKLKGAVAYDETKIDATMANPTTGYFTNKPQAYVHQSEDQKTLTFYYDKLRATRKGHTWDINETKVMQNLSVPAWAGTWEVANETTTKVVFDASFQEVHPTTTAYWFLHYKALTDVQGIEHLNTSQVTDMTAMFSRCLALSTLDLSHFNTKQVTNMGLMFSECTALKQLNLSGFNTENVTNMMYLFNECAALENIDLTHFNTSSVTNMYGLFDGCKSLTALDLKSFNTSEVNEMSRMFSGCQALTQLDLQNFNTANVTDMSYMFSGCSALESLDLSHFNTTNVVDMTRMFSESKKLAHIQCLDSWQCSRSAQMFKGCLQLKGAADYDDSKTDVTMANPETGYFSKYPTAIDRNFLKAHKAQGIYTLQGKRITGNLQHLPAGVYIVNGKKVVVGVRR